MIRYKLKEQKKNRVLITSSYMLCDSFCAEETSLHVFAQWPFAIKLAN